MKLNLFIILTILLLTIESYSDWNQIYSTYRKSFIAASACDSLNIITLGVSQVTGAKRIYRSGDGGVSWVRYLEDSIIYLDPVNLYGMINCNTVSYPKKNLCFIGCDSGRVIVSRDEFATWERYQINTFYYPITKIIMANERIGYFITDFQLFRTLDGGYNWQELRPDLNYSRIWDVSAPDTNNVFLSMNAQNYVGVKINHSSNSGDSWLFTNFVINKQISITFVDSLHGWMRVIDPDYSNNFSFETINYTSDGGETWQCQVHSELSPANGLNYIYACDTNNVIACGPSGKILITYDRGKNWKREFLSDFDTTTNITCSLITTSKTAYIFTYNGLIYKRDLYESGIGIPNLNLDISFIISPNPVEKYCNFNIEIPEPCKLKIEIFNSLGKPVQSILTIYEEYVSAGLYLKQINLSELSSGVYFIIIHAGYEVKTGKILVIK
jgi:hypothetical protein